MCRRLADGSGAAVLALEYRLAPEHPWPASVDDSVAALRWVASTPAELGEPPNGVAVAGDSAGGTLAALACLRLRDEHPEALPDLQALIYANTDLTGACPSMREKATGWGLDANTVRFINTQWVPDQARWSDPAVSPLHAPDLAGLPSAMIVTAEHDPLRDEAETYARRLREAGVEVQPGVDGGRVDERWIVEQAGLHDAHAQPAQQSLGAIGRVQSGGGRRGTPALKTPAGCRAAGRSACQSVAAARARLPRASAPRLARG